VFFVRSTRWVIAGLLAAGLCAEQILLGGWWYPSLAAPGFFLVAVAAVLAATLFWNRSTLPGAWCIGTTLAFAGYLFWRQVNSPDAYAAREDAWLLLGALCVYLAVAWQVRGDGPRWLLLGIIFALSMGQVFLAVTQFTADKAFHPMAGLAAQLRLPDGKMSVANLGLITGTMHARTALSGVLEVTTFLALGLFVWGRCAAWVKLLLLWVCIAGFTGMIICLSRSAYVALPAGVTVFALACFFIVRRGVRERRFLVGSAALALVTMALGLAMATGWESIAVWLRVGEMAVDKYRQDLWSITVPPMLGLDPFFGTGANTFEDLARRYRGLGFTADPIHTHSDWLQLLIEYGRIGLVLGGMWFFAHFAAGWRNMLRMAREAGNSSIFPQSMELGLASGSLAALAAVGSHVVFDYSLHLPAVAMLTALSAGFVASCRVAEDNLWSQDPRWLRPLKMMPALPGVLLVAWLWQDAPAERYALAAENALLGGNADLVLAQTKLGLAVSPHHPRLLFLAGMASREKATSLVDDEISLYTQAAVRAADSFRTAAVTRPSDVFVWNEFGRALDNAAFATEALAVVAPDSAQSQALDRQAEELFFEAQAAHARSIARDPDHARGHEGLARHFLLQEKYKEAERLARLALTLTGSREAGQMVGFLESRSSGAGGRD